MNRLPREATEESDDFFDDQRQTWNDVEIARLSEGHVPTSALRELVLAVETERCVAVVGEPGAGKSATLAALARPELTKGAAPPDFLHAIVFLNPAISLAEFAALLADQLLQNVDGFEDAQYRFCVSTTFEQRQGFDPLFLEVVGPLRLLPGDLVRIAIDGSDQVATELIAPLREFYNLLATHPALPFIRLIVTERSFDRVPPRAHLLQLPPPDEKSLRRYCSKRGLAANVAAQVAATAGGAWLCAKLAGGMAAQDPKIIEQWKPAQSAAEVCVSALGILATNNPDRWQSAQQPLLGLLAAAGAGPVLPLDLLVAAAAIFEPRLELAALHTALSELSPFVTRAAIEGEPERLGVCHEALASVLLDTIANPNVAVDPTAAHAAILAAIDRLAPLEKFDLAEPDALQNYARACEAQHCWKAGQAEQITRRLSVRHWPSARQNQICAEAWLPHLDAQFGYTAEATLALRNQIAHWSGEAGDLPEAIAQFTKLLADQQRVLGKQDPRTFKTRSRIAACTGAAGDAAGALKLCQDLLPVLEKALGKDHPETLAIRNQIANWTGESGDGGGAIELLQKLLADQSRVLGSDHPDTLQTRNNIVLWKGHAGLQSEAIRLSRSLLPDHERLFGKDHPTTLQSRDNIIFWTGEKGDAPNALIMAQELLSDYLRLLGPDHPDTLTLRSKIAFWTGGGGDAKGALRHFEDLRPDMERVLGKLHPDTLAARNSITFWMGVTGDAAGALAEARSLVPDYQRTLGAGHGATTALQRLVTNLEQLERISGQKTSA